MKKSSANRTLHDADIAQLSVEEIAALIRRLVDHLDLRIKERSDEKS